MHRNLARSCAIVGAVLILATPAIAQRSQSAPSATAQRPIGDVSSAANPDSAIWQGLSYRNIGPTNTSGRVADVEGVPGNPNIVFVGSASGGVFKTTNGGISWTCLLY